MTYLLKNNVSKIVIKSLCETTVSEGEFSHMCYKLALISQVNMDKSLSSGPQVLHLKIGGLDLLLPNIPLSSNATFCI